MYLSDKLPKQNYARDFIPLNSEEINLNNSETMKISSNKKQ